MFLSSPPSFPSRDSTHTYGPPPNGTQRASTAALSFVHLFYVLPNESPSPVYFQVHWSFLSSASSHLLCSPSGFPSTSLYWTTPWCLSDVFYKSYLFTDVLHLMSHHHHPFLSFLKYGFFALFEHVYSSRFGVLAYKDQRLGPSEIISIDCSLFLLKGYSPCFFARLIIFC